MMSSTQPPAQRKSWRVSCAARAARTDKPWQQNRRAEVYSRRPPWPHDSAGKQARLRLRLLLMMSSVRHCVRLPTNFARYLTCWMKAMLKPGQIKPGGNDPARALRLDIECFPFILKQL